jgi:hypothetical protein
MMRTHKITVTYFRAIIDESGAAHGAISDLPRGVHVRLADALETGAERGLRVNGWVRDWVIGCG